MFSIDNGTINLSRGDTAAFTVTANADYAFQAEDRALFTVKDASGEVILERVYALDTELGNGVFRVQLSNSDTDQLDTGADIPDRKSVVQGKSVDLGGRRIINKVITPKAAQGLTLIATVGEV